MRIGDRARFETENREVSEFASLRRREHGGGRLTRGSTLRLTAWRDFPSLVKGLRWNRGVREDTSVQIALPPLRSEATHKFDGDSRTAPPCQSGRTDTVETRVVSPSQVRILVAACRLPCRQTVPCVPCRRTQAVNGKRFRTAGVGPAEVRILAAAFPPWSSSDGASLQQGRRTFESYRRDRGTVEESSITRSRRVFTGDPVRRREVLRFHCKEYTQRSTRRFESRPSHWPMPLPRRGQPTSVGERPNSRPSHGRTSGSKAACGFRALEDERSESSSGSNSGWSIL